LKYKKLGDSGIEVSLICLGTMTWGEQNTQDQAFDQMDYALDHGVNFWDAAEMYPVPVRAETFGDTERCIGNWFQQNGRRDEVILASKVTGRSDRVWVRNGNETRVNRAQILEAVEGSLKRLNTDYIDLYQIHWPDRKMGLWGEGAGSYVHKGNEDEAPILEAMEVLGELVESGKIRTAGVSNETPWGVSQYLNASEQHGHPRIVSIQNSYSLLNRIYEGGMSEYSYREDIGLLAYSPLAMGTLSGKYENGQVPESSRLDLFPEFMERYKTSESQSAIDAYVKLAREHAMTPTQLALAFVNTRPFMISNIIGATTIDQLSENIQSVDVAISDELEEAIESIHRRSKNPAAV
jgi:aryl-alcohol dehydrogenase-like predicted oxidoreductase